ncbi:MAG TPA: GPW/gp25 family protein [Baekduia sp.]|nr:GPW/gp25 family protein [Baekduia sp.]
MSRILGTGIAFPLRTDRRGDLALADGEEDVEQAIRLILGTAPGERPMRPEFGCAVHDFVFDRIDADTAGRIEHAVRTALDRWEPRIEVEEVLFEFGDARLGELAIEVRYRLRATSDVRNLVFPFYVIPDEEDEG